MPATKNRKSRHIIQEVRAISVPLHPARRDGFKLPSVTINVVFAKEINTPSGEDAIEWILLTIGLWIAI